MMNVRIDLDASELERFLDLVPEKGQLASSAAVFTEAEYVMSKSRPEVPVDLGVLSGSGHVSLPQRTADGVEVSFGYGGAAQAYAWRQHEETGWQHTVGKAKFLGDPVNAARGSAGSRLAATIRRFLT